MPWDAFQKAIALCGYEQELENIRFANAVGLGFGGEKDDARRSREERVRAIEVELGFD